MVSPVGRALRTTPERMSFHEATITKFCRHDATVEIRLEDVLVDGLKSQVILKISPVASVMIDSELSDSYLMEAGDGEILSLEISDDGISMIIEWNDFSQGKSFTKVYKISGIVSIYTV